MSWLSDKAPVVDKSVNVPQIMYVLHVAEIQLIDLSMQAVKQAGVNGFVGTAEYASDNPQFIVNGSIMVHDSLKQTSVSPTAASHTSW